MRRAVLFCNGEINDMAYHKSLLKENDILIAVDGGGDYCERMGVVPAVAVGDFDSLSEKTKASFEKNQVRMVPFPPEKDYIDMVLGIEEARQCGADEILILGALGGRRVDMLLGNVLALAGYDLPIQIENEHSRIRFLKEGETLCLCGSVGDYVSLLPLSDELSTGVSDGLKYPLVGLTFHRGETRSISNELERETAMICIEKGNAIVVLQKR